MLKIIGSSSISVSASKYNRDSRARQRWPVYTLCKQSHTGRAGTLWLQQSSGGQHSTLWLSGVGGWGGKKKIAC